MGEGTPEETTGEVTLRRVAEVGGGVVGAAIGAAVAGPVGALAGGALPGLLSIGIESLFAGRVRVRRANAAKMLDLALEAANVPLEDFVASVERDLGTERLTSAAIEAATESSFEQKLKALAESLAAGLTAKGRPGVDLELLVIEALRELEPLHVWLLDRLVQWEPSLGGILDGSTGPFGEAASVGLHASEDWGASVRRVPWTTSELRANFCRHQPSTLFGTAWGTLARHGMVDEQDRTEELLQDLRNEIQGTRLRTRQERDTIVRVSEFGRDIHSRLLDAGAVDEVEPGELDLNAQLHGYRSLRYSAKLSTYARELRMRPAEALASESQNRERNESGSGGYQIRTRPDDELDLD